jgi:hypothetical protein
MATRRRRPTAPRPPSLLILQLDAEKLRADGLLLSDLTDFIATVTRLAGTTVITRETTTERHLLDELGELARKGHQFDVIVAFGHSNEHGIRTASDGELTAWGAFAGYLKPFKPKRLMLVACEAGRWPAANALFTKLSTLNHVFASPVNASKDLATLMMAIVPYLVTVKGVRSPAVLKAQKWAVVLTGRQVRHWTKKDKNDPDGLLLDFASQAADPVIRGIHGVVRSWFS